MTLRELFSGIVPSRTRALRAARRGVARVIVLAMIVALGAGCMPSAFIHEDKAAAFKK